ncbi:unnamed protein product [Absidia cylindrospora]
MLWSDPMYGSNECSPAISNSMKSNSKLSSNRHRHQQDDKKLVTKKRKSQASKYMDDDEKRKNFLERNRQAALKCRQRKKQWLNNLQTKVEYLTNDNEQLQIQSNLMRDELIQLRNMLWNHRDCPLNKHSTIKVLNRPLPPGQPIMMPPPLLPPSTNLINENSGNNSNHQHHHSIVTSESSLSSISSSPLSSSPTSTNNIQTSSTSISNHHPQDYMGVAAAIQYSSASPTALLLSSRSDLLPSTS